MIYKNEEIQPKLDKLSHGTNAFQFALSPSGFLLVSKGKVFEVGDFRLFMNGKYYRRTGFNYMTNLDIRDQGMVLCGLSNGKFYADRRDGNVEFASNKNPLSDDFCMVLVMRFGNKTVILIADGQFANEALMITLSDTPTNDAFANALLRKLVGTRSQDIADVLIGEENDSYGKKEG